MMNISARTLRAQQIADAFKQLPDKVQAALIAATAKTMQDAEKKVKAAIPKGDPSAPHIRDSVRVEIGNDMINSISVGPSEYAAALQFGHSNRDGTRTDPVDFFFGPMAKVKKAHRARSRREVRKALREIAAGRP